MNRICAIEISFFIFFYINWIKYWFRKNFRFPVFDGFTRFRISWTRFDYFWKMSVCKCVCDKNFVASVSRELITKISLNFYLVLSYYYLISKDFWWEFLNRYHYSHIFLDKLFSDSSEWNFIKINMQNIHY